MTLTIQTFPVEMYQKIVTQSFPLRSMNQSATRPWGGAGPAISSRPQTQAFVSSVTMAPMRDPELQDLDALITRARGRSGAIRISHALRLAPWYDRNLAGGEWPPTSRSTAITSEFSDGSSYSDGSGFLNGFLPPNVQVYQDAARGANYIVLSGFPASTVNVLRRGDLLEIKPGGISAPFPHLYKAMYGGNSDASGRIGIEIEPRLRVALDAGDTVSLRYPSGLFRLADDNQGESEASDGGIGTIGFSLVEALDLVP